MLIFILILLTQTISIIFMVLTVLTNQAASSYCVLEHGLGHEPDYANIILIVLILTVRTIEIIRMPIILTILILIMLRILLVILILMLVRPILTILTIPIVYNYILYYR